MVYQPKKIIDTDYRHSGQLILANFQNSSRLRDKFTPKTNEEENYQSQYLASEHCGMIKPVFFSSPEPKDTNGLASVRPSSVRRCPQCSKIFFSETAGPIKAKFYVEPPWVGGTIFCSQHLGHMTKMAATPIYGKNPSKIFFSRTGGPIFTKLGM